MPTVNKNDRFHKVMKFLVASTEPPIAKLMMSRGFGDEDRQEGWGLLDTAAGRHLSLSPKAGSFSTEYRVIENELDGWENIWFDVADAALGRSFPAVHAEVFKNLGKTSGSAVVLNVKNLVERLDSLRSAKSEEAAAAAALLEKRGLNAGVLDAAHTLLSQLESAGAVETSEPEVDETALRAEKDAAVDAMWEWYQDWAKTARTVVKNRNYLVMLGLLKPHGGGASSDEYLEEAPASAVSV
jgi:hypothetical protein